MAESAVKRGISDFICNTDTFFYLRAPFRGSRTLLSSLLINYSTQVRKIVQLRQFVEPNPAFFHYRDVRRVPAHDMFWTRGRNSPTTLSITL